MESCCYIVDTSAIVTPALVIFREVLDRNLAMMVDLAKNPARLRPHCKTHKMAEVVRLELERGIFRHKCATLAEAELLAEAGVSDIVLAYPLVGANIPRAVRFREAYPEVQFTVLVDHPRPAEQLAAAMTAAGQRVGVLLDLDTGQRRTGIAPGPAAQELYQFVAQAHGLVAEGLHVYDGQNHQTDIAERRQAVQAVWQQVAEFRDGLVRRGDPVPRIVAGNTGTFPVWAEIQEPALELSPGTCVFHDAGYGRLFPDLPFQPAALLLTRVISCPREDRVTLDLGYKAVASDPAPEKRVVFSALPDARIVLQNEEHLVLQTSAARNLQPGDELLAIPYHVCPTSAMHRQAVVVEGGQVVSHWDVRARDRQLTI